MPDIYEIEGPGGTFEIESDHPPTKDEILKAVRAHGDAIAAREQARLTAGPDGSSVGRFVSGAASMLNPVALVKGAYQAVRHPVDTAVGVVGQMGEQWDKAGDRFDEGRYVEALGHAAAGSVPLIGPAAAATGEKIASGDVAGGLGEMTGMLAPVGVSHAVAARSGSPVRLTRGIKNPNPVEADAIAYGRSQGVPVDVGTAVGNRYIRRTMELADATPVGAAVAAKASRQTATALEDTGRGLVSRVRPGAATDALRAGDRVRTALEAKITQYADDATRAYDALRSFEADPARMVQMQVDVTSAKNALKPLYAELSRRNAVVPFTEGGQARALRALDALMKAPEKAPLTLIEDVLGDLKSMARGADMPELRTAGQGVAAESVKQLQKVVDTTARRAGADVWDALKKGRQATADKYGVAAVRESVGQAIAEPRRLFDALVSKRDAGIERLNAIGQYAPDALPDIGRALLDDMMDVATSEGRFANAGRLYADWQKIGDQTKRMLFGPVTPDLDRFFLLAKKLGEVQNPSGSALSLTSGASGTGLWFAPIETLTTIAAAGAMSKLLRSPKAVKLLNDGLTLTVGPARTSRAAAQSAQASILNALREAGIDRSVVPAMGTEPTQTERPEGQSPR